QTMAHGIAQSSMVTGVKIVNEHGVVMASVGTIPDSVIPHGDSLLAPYQFSLSNLEKQAPKGMRQLGQLTIFSDRSVVLERIKHSFFVILINSLIKTAGLWVIFYLVISNALARPLSRLAEVVSSMEFASEAKELVPLDYPHQDELGRLLKAMDTMWKRLSASREQLDRVNLHLEETVAERTRHLSEALDFINQILMESPLPMGVYAASGRCLVANQAYASMVGATREALLAQNFHIIPTWQRSGLHSACLTALAEHTPQQREINVVTSFGKEVWLEVRILPIRREGEQHLLLQYVDLSVRKQSELALRLAMEEAQSASRTKSEFLAMMSHEIRTPMNAIIGLARLVQETRLDAIQQDYLNNIHDASKALLRILNDILDYSRIEADQLELEQAPFFLAEIFQEVHRLHEANIRERGLTLSMEIDPGLPGAISGDPLRLAQVLNNLVSNAIKFTQQGEIRLRVRSLRQEDAWIECAFDVTDTGIGMDEAMLARLFKPFTQAHSGISRRYGGTGLGLAICHRLVSLMGGEITVQSTPGQGSCFSFTIRAGLVSDAVRTGKPVELAPFAVLQFEPATLLVVEDHPLNQQVAQEYLIRMGLKVHLVNHGVEALEALRHQRFDAVLMDLHMPVMDGIEASLRIRQIPELADLPIIATSASVMNSDRARCESAGIHDFVSKPMDPEALSAVLARWLPLRKGEEDSVQSGLSTREPASEEPEKWYGFDLDKALVRIPDRPLLEEMLSKWLPELIQMERQLPILLNERDWHGLQESVHRIKGVAVNFGAVTLAAAASALEIELAKEERSEGSLTSFRSALALTRATLQSRLSASNPTPDHSCQPGAEEEVAALLKRLLPLVQGCESIPRELQRKLAAYARHPEWGAELQGLLEQLDCFAFESAATAVTTLIGRMS
ncbi:MAG: response regulator, partial [Magnetococcales bacterium]|nr:response regulator [Magnetococcales bacterium]